MDNKIKILIVSTLILVIGGIAAAVVVNKKQSGSQQQGAPMLEMTEKRFDLGTVSMADGLARHMVELTNAGSADLKINSIKTSCMCTEAVLEIDGKKSPKFGMHTSTAFWSAKIKPGQSAKLEITFNPNAHGPDATGPVTRAVTLSSNDQGKSKVRTSIIFTANVVK